LPLFANVTDPLSKVSNLLGCFTPNRCIGPIFSGGAFRVFGVNNHVAGRDYVSSQTTRQDRESL
jgi:hypothetical protein